MEKLELKHLAPYLHHEVKFISSMDDSDDIITNNIIWTLDGVNKLFGSYCLLTRENSDAYDINTCKLILHPLSDLIKEIQHNKQIIALINYISTSKADKQQMLNRIENNHSIDVFEYWKIEKLFSLHFDVFGLIKQGLAIDINTLNN
ncbi:hypothetical protein [Empedobacter brevis]|uniref:hypothetical protein n=1 Tax=Empedobacter brevis TaxID=247 RepID=UPI002896BF8F|nr:hypothetical protein [Empedobacter brevis]